VNVAFSTVQNHSLVQHGNTVKLLRSATNAGFQIQLHVKTDAYGIESTVKLHIFQTDRRIYDFCTFDAYGAGPFDDLVTKVGQKYACILKAIPILAGVQNMLGLNAIYVVFSTAKAITQRTVACHSVICHHNFTSYIDMLRSAWQPAIAPRYYCIHLPEKRPSFFVNFLKETQKEADTV
jgi:hypothetical protein